MGGANSVDRPGTHLNQQANVHSDPIVRWSKSSLSGEVVAEEANTRVKEVIVRPIKTLMPAVWRPRQRIVKANRATISTRGRYTTALSVQYMVCLSVCSSQVGVLSKQLSVRHAKNAG